MGKKNSKLKQETIDVLTHDTYCKYQSLRGPHRPLERYPLVDSFTRFICLWSVYTSGINVILAKVPIALDVRTCGWQRSIKCQIALILCKATSVVATRRRLQCLPPGILLPLHPLLFFFVCFFFWKDNKSNKSVITKLEKVLVTDDWGILVVECHSSVLFSSGAQTLFDHDIHAATNYNSCV